MMDVYWLVMMDIRWVEMTVGVDHDVLLCQGADTVPLYSSSVIDRKPTKSTDCVTVLH